ncbi:MAG TPA: hypothetical protein VIE88_05605 [Vicinamibacteria bacterium]
MCRDLRVLSAWVLAFVLGSLESLDAVPAATVGASFNDKFDSTGTLVEGGRMSDSASPYWWLSSGAYFRLGNGVGSTIQGSLPKNDYWRRYYASTSAIDTENGYRPQNLFRLLTRSRWQNFRQQVYFRIRRDNLTASPNRNASNGLLLMNRYQDENNLYYVGIRVDGAAVIKKKYLGKYYTIGYSKVFPGVYNPTSSPNLLPKNIWLGVRSELRNNPDGTVRITLSVDFGPGDWVLVLDVLDNGLAFGGRAITSSGYGGVRTDFMDVELENYWAVRLD